MSTPNNRRNMKYSIWVHDNISGNQRWAKRPDGKTMTPLTLAGAIKRCALWNESADRHVYSVRPVTSAQPRDLTTVEVSVAL